MSVFTSFAGGRLQAEVPEISSYSVANVSVPTAATEVSITVPDSAMWISIYNRTDGLTKLAFVSGESATNYVTINPGDCHEYSKKSGASMVLYVQCPKASQMIELTYGHL